MTNTLVYSSQREERSGKLYSHLTLLGLIRYLIFFIYLTIPFQFYLNFGSAPVVLGYLVILVIFILFIPALSNRNWKIGYSPLLVPIFVIGLTILISLFKVVSINEFAVKTLHFSLQVLFYFLILNILTNERLIRRAIRFLLIAGLISSLLGIIIFIIVNLSQQGEFLFNLLTVRFAPYLYGARAAQLFAENPFYSWVRTVPGQAFEVIRATALFVTPAENSYFNTGIFFIVLGLRYSLFRKRRLLWWVILIFSLSNVLLAQTRGVWVGVVVALFYYMYKTRILLKPVTLLSLAIIAGVAAGLIFATLGVQNLSAQIDSLISRQDSSSSDRLATMQAALEFIREETFLTGIGPGNVDAVFNAVGNELGFDATTHSMYLDTWVAIGGLGLFAYFWLMFRSWREARFTYNYSSSNFLKDLATGYQYLWIALMVIHVFQGNLFGNPKTNLMVWGIIGVISVGNRITRNEMNLQLN